MNQKKALHKTSIGVTVILVFTVFIYLLSQQSTATIVLNCTNGSFERFSEAKQSPLCIGCTVTSQCEGEISVLTSSGLQVCQNTFISSRPDFVEIPCGELKNYRGATLEIRSSTNSSRYGEQSNTVKTLYDK